MRRGCFYETNSLAAEGPVRIRSMLCGSGSGDGRVSQFRWRKRKFDPLDSGS